MGWQGSTLDKLKSKWEETFNVIKILDYFKNEGESINKFSDETKVRLAFAMHQESCTTLSHYQHLVVDKSNRLCYPIYEKQAEDASKFRIVGSGAESQLGVRKHAHFIQE